MSDDVFYSSAAATSFMAATRAVQSASKVIFDDDFDDAINEIADCCDRGSRIILTGVGKSGMVAHRTASSFASIGIPAYYLHAGDAVHGDCGLVQRGDHVIALTHSGRTAELRYLLEHVAKRGIKSTIITGSGRDAERLPSAAFVLAYEADDLLGHMPTASCVAQAAIGDALLAALVERLGYGLPKFRANHPGGSLGERLQV